MEYCDDYSTRIITKGEGKNERKKVFTLRYVNAKKKKDNYVRRKKHKEIILSIIN